MAFKLLSINQKITVKNEKGKNENKGFINNFIFHIDIESSFCPSNITAKY